MYKQLIKPGGQLATLIFPVDPNKDRNEGPPFPLTPELYTELLEPLGMLPFSMTMMHHTHQMHLKVLCASMLPLLRQAGDWLSCRAHTLV